MSTALKTQPSATQPLERLRRGRNIGIMTITNRATNTADAQRAIRTWARALRSGLDGLHKGGA